MKSDLRINQEVITHATATLTLDEKEIEALNRILSSSTQEAAMIAKRSREAAHKIFPDGDVGILGELLLALWSFGNQLKESRALLLTSK